MQEQTQSEEAKQSSEQDLHDTDIGNIKQGI